MSIIIMLYYQVIHPHHTKQPYSKVSTHIILFCWERTNSHPGGVGLDNTVYPTKM